MKELSNKRQINSSARPQLSTLTVEASSLPLSCRNIDKRSLRMGGTVGAAEGGKRCN